jgi:hypothetical protein
MFIAAAAAFLVAAGADEALAAKQCPRTKNRCIATCRKVGDSPNGCVKYCDDKERNTGCP